MKKRFYTVGLIIILVITGFSFVIAPALVGGNNSGAMPAFGKYNGKQIKYEPNSDFANYVSNYANLIQNQGGTVDINVYFEIFQAAFNATVQKIAFTQAVEKSGYTVPQSAINRLLIPNFSDENGNYSQKRYKETPVSEIEKMQNNYREQLSLMRYSDDMFGSTNKFGDTKLYGLKLSENEKSFLNDYDKTKRSFNLASFSLNNYPDSEKIAFANANSQKFIKYDMSVITCNDKAKAETVLKRLSNNEIIFADAINEYSTKIYSDDTGKLTEAYNYQLEKIVKNTDDFTKLTSLAKDANSEVIQTSIGFSIFQKNAENIALDVNNEQMLSDVYSYLKNYETGHIEDYYINIAKNFAGVAATNSFDKACNDFNVEKTEVEAFPLNYGSVSIATSVDTTIDGLTNANINENFLQTAFSLKENEISSPIVNGNNVIVLQFTKETINEEQKEVTDLEGKIEGFDQMSLSSVLMTSEKLENNLVNVFYDNFLNTTGN